VWRWGLSAAVVAAAVWMILGPSRQPVATAAVVEEKTYTVTPAAMKVKAGIITGRGDGHEGHRNGSSKARAASSRRRSSRRRSC